MKNNKLLIALAIAALAGSVFADEDGVNYSLSLKTWNSNLNVANSSTNVNTQSLNAPIVTLVARKGDYFVSATGMLESSYRYKSVWLARKDYDYALGYRYTDNISFLGGYKTMVFRDGSQSNWVETTTGYYLGISGFKLVNDRNYVYGNYQYIPSMKTSTTGTDYYNSQKAFSSEVGYGYVLNNTTQLTAGYRYQQGKSYNITQSRNETNTMRGLLAGVNVNF